MPSYKRLNADTLAGKRTIERLMALRKDLDERIPARRTLESGLLLATWNIREFDSSKYGARTEESYYYIAEIVARFDLVAIQEVREDLSALNKLMEILGSNWIYLFTDVTIGTAGNSERMAFVFDSRKVQLGGLVGQLVIPPLKIKDNVTGKFVFKEVQQIARTPFLCGFKAGWTDFILATVHILYGEDKADSPDRVEEIRKVANFLAERSEDPRAWSQNWVLLGDFNIYAPEDVTMNALRVAGFVVPKELQRLPSNIAQDKFYDQIAFRVRPDRFATREQAGVYNFFNVVFRGDDEAEYGALMGDAYLTKKSGEARTQKERTQYYRDWRTFQMSDHLPMWVELKIDYSDEYLERKLRGEVA
jgi:exonuclease III